MNDVQDMTLRDYFAAKAMQALIAAWAPGQQSDEQWPGDAHLASESYAIADAMLAERAWSQK